MSDDLPPENLTITPLERFAKYTRINEYEDFEGNLAYQVVFVVATPDGHHQEFVIDMSSIEHDKDRAEWFAWQLQKALARLVKHELTAESGGERTELLRLRRLLVEWDESFGKCIDSDAGFRLQREARRCRELTKGE